MIAFKIDKKEIFDKYFRLVSFNYYYNFTKSEMETNEDYLIEKFIPCEYDNFND